MFKWLRRRQQAERLAQADAAALVRDHGAEAYGEARQRERDVVLLDGTTHAGRTPAHWRRVALIVARMTGKRVGLDTATRPTPTLFGEWLRRSDRSGPRRGRQATRQFPALSSRHGGFRL